MNKKNKNGIISQPRKGCRDIWNAYMADGAMLCEHDIPFCPTTAKEVPKDILTWDEAIAINKKQMSIHNHNYVVEAFVCFYIDDYKFDSKNGIWYKPDYAVKVLKHFKGVITPDYSTYQDFPEPLKLIATYRMRLIGWWFGVKGLSVINNVRWGTDETFEYCFAGIPTNSIVSIGTVGGSPRKHQDRERFEIGLCKMVEVLHPHTIIVYGSSKYHCFDLLREKGINIVSFQSKTSKVFEGRKYK